MKPLIQRPSFLILITLALTLHGCSRESALKGTWEGTDNAFGKTVKLSFTNDGSMTFFLGRTIQGTFTLDESVNPHAFTLNLDGRNAINTILIFNSPNEFAFENINSSDPLPEKIGDRKIVMKRVKP